MDGLEKVRTGITVLEILRLVLLLLSGGQRASLIPEIRTLCSQIFLRTMESGAYAYFAMVDNGSYAKNAPVASCEVARIKIGFDFGMTFFQPLFCHEVRPRRRCELRANYCKK